MEYSDLVLLKRMCGVRPTANKWADQSAKGFGSGGRVAKAPALILTFNFCESRKIMGLPPVEVVDHSSRLATERNARFIPRPA